MAFTPTHDPVGWYTIVAAPDCARSCATFPTKSCSAVDPVTYTTFGSALHGAPRSRNGGAPASASGIATSIDASAAPASITGSAGDPSNAAIRTALSNGVHSARVHACSSSLFVASGAGAHASSV